MHINVAAVNASPIQQTRTKNALESYNRSDSINLNVRYFLSGKELLRDIETRGQYDLYIFDVVIPEMDGVTIAEKIRASGDRGKIVFINGDTTHAHKAFSVHADDYRLWPLNANDLRESLDWLLVDILEHVNSPVHCIRHKGGFMRSQVSNIVYVEAVDRIAHYHMLNGCEYSGKCLRKSFSEEMAELLEYNCMIKAGTSFIVNLQHIKSMERSIGIEMWTGEIIMPPRYRWGEIDRAWKRYLEE